jgi:hypothetical protein
VVFGLGKEIGRYGEANSEETAVWISGVVDAGWLHLV